MTSGVAIGRSSVPSWSPPSPATARDAPTSCASFGRSANGRFQLSALRNAAVRFSRVSGNSTWTRAPPAGRVSVNDAESVISAIGVMPAIGSFEKLPSAYDTAPIRRPST